MTDAFRWRQEGREGGVNVTFGFWSPCCLQARGMLMEERRGCWLCRCKIERQCERASASVSVCVRRFHGNLSRVCLFPRDVEERRVERREMRGEEKTIPH